MVEQLTLNQRVVGSSPTRFTKYSMFMRPWAVSDFGVTQADLSCQPCVSAPAAEEVERISNGYDVAKSRTTAAAQLRVQLLQPSRWPGPGVGF